MNFGETWQGITNAFKKVGGAVKRTASAIAKPFSKAFGEAGKAVGEIGMAGQIGLSMILPGMGSALGGALNSGVGALASSTNPILSEMGRVMQVAGKFGATTGNAFKTVSEGVMSFVSKAGKDFMSSVSNKFGNDVTDTPQVNSPTDGFANWVKGVSEFAKGDRSSRSESSAEVAMGIDQEYTRSFEETINISEDQDQDTSDNLSRKIEPKSSGPFNFQRGDLRFNEVDNSSMENIENTERSAMADFFGKVRNSALQSNGESDTQPTRDTVNQAAQSVKGGGMKSQNRIEEPQEPKEVSRRYIPEFNPQSVDTAYERAGLNYGALPSNRAQYHAYNRGVGEFGRTPIRTFSRPRMVNNNA